MRILSICSDRQLAEVITSCLSVQGHAIEWVAQPQDPPAYGSGAFDAIVVVWSQTAEPGFEWLRTLRIRLPLTPLVVVTTAADAAPVARELNLLECKLIVYAGSSTTLAARLCEVLASIPAIGEEQFQCGDIHFDLRRRLVRRKDRWITLTDREWLVVEELAKASATPISKSELAARVIANAEHPENAVEVHISSIRRKLGRDLIETLRGIGYRLKR